MGGRWRGGGGGGGLRKRGGRGSQGWGGETQAFRAARTGGRATQRRCHGRRHRRIGRDRRQLGDRWRRIGRRAERWGGGWHADGRRRFWLGRLPLRSRRKRFESI